MQGIGVGMAKMRVYEGQTPPPTCVPLGRDVLHFAVRFRQRKRFFAKGKPVIVCGEH